MKCKHGYCRTRTFTGLLFREFLHYVSFSKIKGKECLSVIPVYCSPSNTEKQNVTVKNNLIDLNVKLSSIKSMGFTVYSYTHVLITLKSLQIHITQSIKLRGYDRHVAVKTPTHCKPNSSPNPPSFIL